MSYSCKICHLTDAGTTLCDFSIKHIPLPQQRPSIRQETNTKTEIGVWHELQTSNPGIWGVAAVLEKKKKERDWRYSFEDCSPTVLSCFSPSMMWNGSFSSGQAFIAFL